MSDPVWAAKSARESLARALAAVQSGPGTPQGIMAVAEPVSIAMGALFQIERSGGAAVAQSGPTALDAVRRALAMLQEQPANHPAVKIASEAVAGALGLVHGLATVLPASPAQKLPPAPALAHAPARAYAPAPAGAPPQPEARGPQAYAATHVAPADPRPLAPHASPPAQPGAAAPPSASSRIEAELGAHSPSNFYKGLSGNDVVEHGGLFIATYKIPPVGHPVSLHVVLPGGYEFDAPAIVRWTRETLESGQGAPPGFGAQFTQITAEARQLIYRYVRNREPLFHDDL